MLLAELVALIPEGKEVADTFVSTCRLVINCLHALLSLASELRIKCVADKL